MKTTPRLLSLLAIVSTLAFMLASTSCTTAQVDAFKSKASAVSLSYTKKAGITPSQTFTLGWNWWMDYNAASEANAILATQASPVTSAKDTLVVRP